MASLDIEKKSLEAHVEICAVRYSNLETQLQNLETRMDKVEGYLIEIKEAIAKATRPAPEAKSNDEATAPYKMMLTIGTTIGGALIGAIITLVVHIK
jgi:chaperonin cofactor prefoldin